MRDADRPVGAAPAQPASTVQRRRWAHVLDLCEVSEQDLALLADAVPVAELCAVVARRLRDHLLAYPELAGLVRGGRGFELKLRSYVESCFSGQLDEQRPGRLLRIAEAHDRVGVPLTCFIGATLQIDALVIAALVEHHHQQPVLLQRLLIAWRRLFTADVAMVAQSFVELRDRTTSMVVQAAGFED